MDITSNPRVRAEYESLKAQFGDKALLDLDDYCSLFNLARRKASCHVHDHGVPHIVMGRTIYISMYDLALYLAQKKAEQSGKLLAIQKTAQDIKDRRGFRQKAIKKQLNEKK